MLVIGLLMLVVLVLGLVLSVIAACVRMLFRRQASVQLNRAEAEQLARLDRSLERMEERIGNMETILLNKDNVDELQLR